MTSTLRPPSWRKLFTVVAMAGALAVGAAATATPAAAKCGVGPSCWGSVVTNPGASAWGYAYNYVSGRAANNAAQAKCPGYCRVYVIFKNSCGAIAVGDNGVYGWAANKSRKWAKYYAVRNCSKYGFHCKLRVWACTRYSWR